MAVFLISAEKNNPALDARIKARFPEKHFKLTDNTWMISSELLTRQVSDELAITGGSSGQAGVFRVDNYFGWHRKDLWEWLDRETKAST